VLSMKNILEKVDKILKEARQEKKVKVKTRFDLLIETIKRTQEKKITFTAEGQQGEKEVLMVTPRGVFLWDESRYVYARMIKLSYKTITNPPHKEIEEWANSSGAVGSVLQKALAGEVEIKIT